MQSEQYSDGSKLVEVFSCKDDKEFKKLQKKKFATAIEGGAVAVTQKQMGRNDKCLCGSGLKFKKCCLKYNNKGVRIPVEFWKK